MKFRRERFQVASRAKSVVQFRGVGNPVPVVGISIGRAWTFVVLRDRTDPDRREPCILDIVEVFADRIPGPTTPRLVSRVALG